jgi:hypothetical protein
MSRTHPTPADPNDDLETLPFLDELEDDAPVAGANIALVHVKHAPATDGAHDLCFELAVGDMDKKEVADALAVPLAAKIAELGEKLRWKRVLVLFTGSTLIPSAARDRVGALLAEAKACRVTVQRGLGDERVHEVERPGAKVAVTEPEIGRLRVAVDAAGLEAADLAGALAAELATIGPLGADKRVDVVVDGPQPGADAVEQIRRAFASAARLSLATGGGAAQVLADRALEARVRVRPDERGSVDVEIGGDGDEKASVEALQVVLRGARAQIAGKRVAVRFSGRLAQPRELDALRALASELEPGRVDVTAAAGDKAQLLWPPLVHASRLGKETTLQINPEGRNRSAMIAALQQELPSLAADIKGRNVTVDWPQHFEDEEIERACEQSLAQQGAARVAFSYRGQQREPIVPRPIEVRAGEGGRRAVTLDTDAGAPDELVRTIERRLAGAGLAGAAVDIAVKGSGPLSRTMRRTLLERLEAAGVGRATLDDRGNREVLLPKLLAVSPLPGGEVRVAIDVGGRSVDQLARALAEDLERAVIARGASVHLQGTTEESVVRALVRRGAARVLLDDESGVQAHPPLFAVIARDGDSLVLRAEPALDDAVSTAQVERELPRAIAAQGDLAEVTVILEWPDARPPVGAPVARAVEILVDAQPRALLLESGDGTAVQLHPEPDVGMDTPEPWSISGEELPEPELTEPEFELVENEPEPTADAEMKLDLFDLEVEEPRPAVTILGRRPQAQPPLLMLGIDCHAGDAIEGALAAHHAEVENNRVLVVFLDRGEPTELRSDDARVAAVRTALEPHAAALLLWRDATLVAPAHFEVVASRVESLAVGARMRDPRRR